MFGELRKVYFLHLPKAAGTSIRYWLWDAFSIEDFLECHHLPDLQVIDSSKLYRAMFYSGHFGLRLWELLPSHPVTLALLREPLGRVCSELSYFCSMPEDQVRQLQPGSWTDPGYVELARSRDWSALLKSKLYIGGFANMQVRFLGGYPPNGDLSFVSGATYDRARQALEALDTFGIFERMAESLLLFCERLCWPPATCLPKLNETPVADSAFRESLREAAPLILETNAWDLKLYEFARELFESRLSTLRLRLGPVEQSRYDGATIEALKSALLARFLNTPFSGWPLRCGRITQASGLLIDGWTTRFYWPAVNRWLRRPRAQKSVIYLPLDRSRGSIEARFEIFFPRDPERLELHVDGSQVPLCRLNVSQDDETHLCLLKARLWALPSSIRRWTTISIIGPTSALDAALTTSDEFALGDISLL